MLCGREEADRVVAPVVRQAALDEVVVLHELVHRHQLDGRDPELLQVLDHHGVGQRGVGAADLLGDVRVGHGEALDVRLVDDRLVVGRARVAVVLPVEERADHDRLHHVRGAVELVALLRVLEVVAEQRLVPVGRTLDRLGVGVEQQLGGVAPLPLRRVVGAVDPEAVALARPRPGAGSRARPRRRPRAGRARVSLPSSSNRQSSTRSATSEKRAKLVPAPSKVAPRGYAVPGQISMTVNCR